MAHAFSSNGQCSIPQRIRFQWSGVTLKYFLISIYCKHDHCLAATTVDTGDTVGTEKCDLTLRGSNMLVGKIKIKQMSTVTNATKVKHREGMRVYNKLFGLIRKVKGGLPEEVKLELTSDKWE